MCNRKHTLPFQSDYSLDMRKILQTLAISALFLAPAAAVDAQVNFGIRIGEPPAPRQYRVARAPGPDYVWIEGYWYPQGARYTWHNGYWTRPPYEGAYWVAPYNSGGRYFVGRWEGSRGNVNHNHRWDRGNQRDERRDPRPDDRNDGRGRR